LSCNICYDLCTVILGDPSYRIGSITDTTTAVLVYFESIGTGRIEVQEITSDGSGNIDVDLSTGFESGQGYRIKVSSFWYGSTYKDITPTTGGVTTYTCMEFTADKRC